MALFKEGRQIAYHEIEDESHDNVMSKAPTRQWLVVAYIMFGSLCCLATFLAGMYIGRPTINQTAASPVPASTILILIALQGQDQKLMRNSTSISGNIHTGPSIWRSCLARV